MLKRFSLNNANKEQRLIMQELSIAANSCPPSIDREAFSDYQEKVLQPIRNRIIAAGVN